MKRLIWKKLKMENYNLNHAQNMSCYRLVVETCLALIE